MSFSSTIKEELARHAGEARHCRIAELAAIINLCGTVEKDASGAFSIQVHTENGAVARKYFTLLKKTFNMKVEVSTRKSEQLKRHNVYTMQTGEAEDAERVLKATRLLEDGKFKHRIHPLIVQATCCKRAYIRGAFLASGSMSDPEKTYHLEFVDHDASHCRKLQALLAEFDIDARIVLRKKYHVLYLKEGRSIVDLLNVMEAHVALMELENLRILKEMRNNVNRIVNCETANLNKTVSAAVRQIHDIEYIQETVGLDTLPEQLEAIAAARLENQDASLKELGQMLYPPIGKSGVNHRLRKLCEIADSIRKQREDTDD